MVQGESSNGVSALGISVRNDHPSELGNSDEKHRNDATNQKSAADSDDGRKGAHAEGTKD